MLLALLLIIAGVVIVSLTSLSQPSGPKKGGTPASSKASTSPPDSPGSSGKGKQRDDGKASGNPQGKTRHPKLQEAGEYLDEIAKTRIRYQGLVEMARGVHEAYAKVRCLSIVHLCDLRNPLANSFQEFLSRDKRTAAKPEPITEASLFKAIKWYSELTEKPTPQQLASAKETVKKAIQVLQYEEELNTICAAGYSEMAAAAASSSGAPLDDVAAFLEELPRPGRKAVEKALKTMGSPIEASDEPHILVAHMAQVAFNSLDQANERLKATIEDTKKALAEFKESNK
ncbi:hypothetical protein BDV25DRAFT_113595 [Aspergillus avenaceus]|uniref:Hydrophobic surface binding protein A-domain-containing protein n=1 Tax=Aspergillus avenaceus TaxID=36643 RepID=A0A5N6TVF3_ASPAV|nr:hypothetical protein BDV25DRAFT_113595 [Aspergillus avenaceus]